MVIMQTYGHLVGEVVRRVSGKTIGQYFDDELAKPLGLDFWIGLPEDKFSRVTDLHPNKPVYCKGCLCLFY